MCFYIHEDHPSQLLADHDIECYKILEHDPITLSLFGPHYCQIYFKKSDTHPKIVKVESFGLHNIDTIDEGFHSYSTYEKAKYAHESLLRSYVGLEIFTIHKCIIPTGTKYYYNPDQQEYVSLALKLYKKNIKK